MLKLSHLWPASTSLIPKPFNMTTVFFNSFSDFRLLLYIFWPMKWAISPKNPTIFKKEMVLKDQNLTVQLVHPCCIIIGSR